MNSSGLTAANFILNSDKVLKKNIENIELSKINKIRFVQFNMKSDPIERKRYGVIAQEVEEIMPELVYTDNDGIKSVGYIDLLIAKIADLESRIIKMESNCGN
jgi:hypothetical protein